MKKKKEAKKVKKLQVSYDMEEDREKEEGARKITIVREAFVKENLVKNQTLTIIDVKRFLNKIYEVLRIYTVVHVILII